MCAEAAPFDFTHEVGNGRPRPAEVELLYGGPDHRLDIASQEAGVRDPATLPGQQRAQGRVSAEAPEQAIALGPPQPEFLRRRIHGCSRHEFLRSKGRQDAHAVPADAPSGVIIRMNVWGTRQVSLGSGTIILVEDELASMKENRRR